MRSALEQRWQACARHRIHPRGRSPTTKNSRPQTFQRRRGADASRRTPRRFALRLRAIRPYQSYNSKTIWKPCKKPRRTVMEQAGSGRVGGRQGLCVRECSESHFSHGFTRRKHGPRLVHPCLSLSLLVSPCLSLSLLVSPCLSLFIRGSFSISNKHSQSRSDGFRGTRKTARDLPLGAGVEGVAEGVAEKVQGEQSY